jgi:hypothetical protein
VLVAASLAMESGRGAAAGYGVPLEVGALRTCRVPGEFLVAFGLGCAASRISLVQARHANRAGSGVRCSCRGHRSRRHLEAGRGGALRLGRGGGVLLPAQPGITADAVTRAADFRRVCRACCHAWG